MTRDGEKSKTVEICVSKCVENFGKAFREQCPLFFTKEVKNAVVGNVL